jgi:hypothetical protein
MKNQFQAFIAGVCIAAGLVAVGYGVKSGLESFSNRERVVTVKGLAEKDVKAVSANISIDYSFSGNDLQSLLAQIKARTSDIQDYLKEKNVQDIAESDLNLTDRQSYYDSSYNDKGELVKKPINRYSVEKTLSISTNNVETVAQTAAQFNFDLINKDMKATVSTNYNYPDLNSIKPALIAESTKNSRIAGEQFAKDSHSALGKIKTASQGPISIAGQYYSSDDDANTSKPDEPFYERVRVVSTIVFYLED